MPVVEYKDPAGFLRSNVISTSFQPHCLLLDHFTHYFLFLISSFPFPSYVNPIYVRPSSQESQNPLQMRVSGSHTAVPLIRHCVSPLFGF